MKNASNVRSLLQLSTCLSFLISNPIDNLSTKHWADTWNRTGFFPTYSHINLWFYNSQISRSIDIEQIHWPKFKTDEISRITWRLTHHSSIQPSTHLPVPLLTISSHLSTSTMRADFAPLQHEFFSNFPSPAPYKCCPRTQITVLYRHTWIESFRRTFYEKFDHHERSLRLLHNRFSSILYENFQWPFCKRLRMSVFGAQLSAQLSLCVAPFWI